MLMLCYVGFLVGWSLHVRSKRHFFIFKNRVHMTKKIRSLGTVSE